MDEVTDLLNDAVCLGSRLDSSTSTPLNRSSQYKQRAGRDQQQRRAKLLELQKRGRKEILNDLRHINDDDRKLFKDDYEQMDTSGGSASRDARNQKRQNNLYKDQLMLSEWMIEIPEDFQTSWLMVSCPVGKRCLVLATQGTTYAYSKSGYRLNQFPSLLPGGCKATRRPNNAKTLLDCIYCETSREYRVLDVLCWAGQYFVDCEAEFRFFWSKSKLDETPQVGEYSRMNLFRFVAASVYDCTAESVATALSATPLLQVDGLLFYHRRAHYLSGSTPLVVWLKPYMIPEVLGVAVHEDYTKDRPASYTDIDTHLSLVRSDKSVARKHQDLYTSPDSGGSSRSQSDRLLRPARLTADSPPHRPPPSGSEPPQSLQRAGHAFGRVTGLSAVTADCAGTSSVSEGPSSLATRGATDTNGPFSSFYAPAPESGTHLTAGESGALPGVGRVGLCSPEVSASPRVDAGEPSGSETAGSEPSINQWTTYR